MRNIDYHNDFIISTHEHGIVEVGLSLSVNQGISAAHILAFFKLANDWLSRAEVASLFYHLLPDDSYHDVDYKAWIISAQQEDASKYIKQIDQYWLKLQSYNKPIIGLIDNDCVGTHFSWMLWADYRIVIGSRSNFGFPEAAFGILPAFGAVSRMLQLWNEDIAFQVATQHEVMGLKEALTLGIIDQQVKGKDDVLAVIRSIVQQGKSPEKLNKVKDDEPQISMKPARSNPLFPGVAASQEIVKAHKAGVDTSALLELEHDLYCQVATSDIVTALLRTNYYGILSAKKQAKNSALRANHEVKRIAVVGAGMMGSGIAFESARAGIAVKLVDIDIEKANQGKNYAQKVTNKLLVQGKMTSEKQSEILQRIQPSSNLSDIRSAEILVEAVFEDMTLKTELIAKISPNLPPQAVLASNTTSLPINQLAQASYCPASLIGLHFFSPVDRMPLVEVIMGKDTAESTKDIALKYIHQLDKIPIIVQDGPGFFTSRIFFNYLLEGITMVLEGISPYHVEKSARAAGFPVGPLLVLDEISLPLMLHVYDQLPELHEAQLNAYTYLKDLIAKGKTGRKGNAGFYSYDEHGKRQNLVASQEANPSSDDLHILEKRLLHVVALDAFRCLVNGIIAQPIDGDLGSVLGIGFAPHTGGVFSHIDQVGLAQFTTECEAFESHGAQWQIPSELYDLARQDFSFYDGFQSRWNPS
ncbi:MULTISPECIES: 3-hydroxyacyl-CoA dehydrogenase NAD-binding domain-containing protein [Sphingobacterium]|uniref:3-hydroxyacyl-CoA dehydrogenase NAD-binding domain-containing protein n=1 Tax=Sphingobacterium populi TaxID=1812824 RepID=A0ABW5UFZ5_9SPHI|nr:3-hydroxyacyl-CoA dehydrogenase NAD-binding domain-containing protein [Sphingobacterium sp. CFCC 11742]